MTDVVNALERHDPRRIVLFDSPPLLVSSESRALAAFAGQVVLVVCAGKTPHAAVLNALSQFPEGKQINLVLNQGLTTLTDDYFSYGGYGNYGGYGSSAGESVPQS
jgi:Mrp family chromosome partitioning ATPase